MSKRWIITPAAPDRDALAARWRVSSLIAQILINRGVATERPCDAFLSPQLADLHQPDALPGAMQAAELIVDAVRARRRIVLYGDYDVDGTTGVAILWHVLRLAGVDAQFYVPHRIDEGYGLNRAAVTRLADEGAELIISVDCGVTAVEIADELNKRGVPLIITDHHTPRDTLPDAAAIVHPALDGSTYPNPHLCGAGVAFKLAWAVAQRFCGAEKVDDAFRELLRELVPLAALGTIADVVPLTGENRIIARHGLRQLPASGFVGIRALIEATGLTGEKIDAYDVGFKIAPRINAAGRMGHARLAVELFTRADANRAREIAKYLESQNKARRAAELKIVKHANETIERDSLAADSRRAIVLASNQWHAGVIGIVAGRLASRYHRPTVLVAITDDEGQGSARSIAHFDLAAALAECDEHLLGHGGHAMAAGLRIAADKVDCFTEAFVELANNRLTGEDLIPKLRLDAEVSLSELTAPTVRALTELGPFGMGNPQPVLASDWLDLAYEPRCVGKSGAHLQASFRENGSTIRGIGFGLGHHLEDLKHRRRCRVAFEPMINDFNGRQSVEMRIVDLQFAGG